MSADDRQGGAGRREVAWRLFATEYEDATLQYSEDGEERAPNYVVTPTGARVNRLFVVGVLTEIEAVTDEVLRARVVDPTGAFVAYAGQYQPDAVAYLEDASPPDYVAVTGKARTYQPEDSDRVFTSVRPESINTVDADTRDRWTVQAAAQTVERISTMAAALESEKRGQDLTATLLDAGVDYGLASGVPLAIDHYGTTTAYLAALRRVAVDAARVVAGEIDEVEPLDVAPGEGGPVETDLAADVDLQAGVTGPAASGSEPPSGGVTPSRDASTAGPDESEPTASAPAEDTEAAGAEPVAEAEAEAADGPASDTGDATEAADASTETAEPDEAVEGEFELDDEERDRIEAEYGTEFSTGTEVDGPGEAEIDTPGGEDLEAPAVEADEVDDGTDTDTDAAVEPPAETAADAAGESESESESGSESEEPETTDTDEGDEEPADLEAAVVSAMREVDEGDGADREAVVETVVAAHDVDAEAVEDAIQSALMSGKCYEPAEGRLKAI